LYLERVNKNFLLFANFALYLQRYCAITQTIEQFEPLSAQARSLLYVLTGAIVIPDFEEIVLVDPISERAQKVIPASLLAISPNPAATFMIVTMQSDAGAYYSIKDCLGKEVQAGLLVAERTQIQLPESITPGIYFFKYTATSGETIVQRFVISK
jgi:hypothetical protein